MNRKSQTIVILITLIITSLACGISGSPTQAPPITQVIQVTQIVPVTQIAPATPTLLPAIQMEVFANEDWQTTKVFIQNGQYLKITYLSGQWSQCAGYGGDACGYVDADGMSFESPADNIMSSGCKDAKLIARVSSSSPICVGGQFYGRIGDTGFLELRINDALINDNGGSITVLIELENR